MVKLNTLRVVNETTEILMSFNHFDTDVGQNSKSGRNGTKSPVKFVNMYTSPS